MTVPTQRAPNCFDIRAVLSRETKNDRGVARVGVALVAGFVVVEEQLAEPSICAPADRRGVAQSVKLKREVLARASIWQPLSPRYRCHGNSRSLLLGEPGQHRGLREVDVTVDTAAGRKISRLSPTPESHA